MTDETVASRLQLERVVDCPFSAAQDHVTDCLRRHRFARAPNRLVLRPDMAEPGKPHDELYIRWHPLVPIVPRLDIVLRFRIVRLSTRILLLCEYSAPFGTPGAIIDRTIGRHIMRAILAGLLAWIAAHVERNERRYRSQNPPLLGISTIAMHDGAPRVSEAL